jgi:hypothetical protein
MDPATWRCSSSTTFFRPSPTILTQEDQCLSFGPSLWSTSSISETFTTLRSIFPITEPSNALAMKIQALLVSTLVALAGCSPAQGDCTQECSTVSNDCAVTYVAYVLQALKSISLSAAFQRIIPNSTVRCRTGCGGALDALPSLTAPACVSNATAAAVVMAAPVVTDAPTPIVDPLTMITPAPEDPASKSGYCRAAWVCDDNYIVCGSQTIPYGG